MGFAMAAFIACELIVTMATINATIDAAANTHQSIWIR